MTQDGWTYVLIWRIPLWGYDSAFFWEDEEEFIGSTIVNLLKEGITEFRLLPREAMGRVYRMC